MHNAHKLSTQCQPADGSLFSDNVRAWPWYADDAAGEFDAAVSA